MLESNFESSHQNFEQNEQFEQALKSILPEIERQLMKDIQQQLEGQFQQKYLKQIQEINKQALEQYQSALSQLNESSKMLQKQKQSQIAKEINHYEMAFNVMKQERLIRMQQHFLQEHFQTRVMAHSRIHQLERQIEEQIYSMLEEKHQATKQRQIKQLIIGHQTKQIKLRKQLDIQIKSRIYSSSGLEQLKQEIKQSRTQMGSQKSEYNLKLKRIQTQIKQYQGKIKQIQKMENLQNLREKQEQLKIQLIQIEANQQLNQQEENRRKLIEEKNKNISDDEEQYQHNNDDRIQLDSLDGNEIDKRQNNEGSFGIHKNNFAFSGRSTKNQNKNQQKILKRQNNKNSLSNDGRFVNHQISLNGQEEYDQQSQYQAPAINQNNSKKFDLTAYFKDYLINSQTAKITESQNIIIHNDEKKKSSLLSLQNIGELLRQKVALDPLQKYLNKQSVSKQNNKNYENIKYSNGQKSSNFAQLYEQHLKNINKNLARKAQQNIKLNEKNQTGISQLTKKKIIKNLSQYHRNTFYNNTINPSSTPPLVTNQENNVGNIQMSNYNTYQSNLLASYK